MLSAGAPARPPTSPASAPGDPASPPAPPGEPDSVTPPSGAAPPSPVANDSTSPPRVWQPAAKSESAKASAKPSGRAQRAAIRQSGRIAHPQHEAPPGAAHGDVRLALHVPRDGRCHVAELAAERGDEPTSERRRDTRADERSRPRRRLDAQVHR